MPVLLEFLAIWGVRIAVSIILGFSAWAVLVSIFDPKGLPKVKQLIYNWTSGGFSLIGTAMGDLAPGIAAAAQAVIQAVNANGGAIMAVFRDPAAALAETVFKEQFDALTTGGLSTPDNATQTASLAMGTAFGRGVGSAAVTAAFEAAFPEKLNTLNAAGPILAKMAGFDSVADAVLDPLYSNAFGKSLEYLYRSTFKPEYPDEDDAVRWHSQRLLTDDDLRKVFEVSGLKSEYEPAYIQSAYRAIQPRVLTSLFEDLPFPEKQVRGMLAFSGVRQADLEILVEAYKYASVKNVRNQYLASIVLAAERGVIDDATLDSVRDLTTQPG